MSQIKVMATAAFKEAYLVLVPQFEHATGHQIVTTWATTADIVSRVKAGETTDLAVMSGNAIDELITAGKFAQGSRVDVASSWVAMAVQQGAPKPDIGTVEALKKTLMEAKSVAWSASASGVSGRMYTGAAHLARNFARVPAWILGCARMNYPPQAPTEGQAFFSMPMKSSSLILPAAYAPTASNTLTTVRSCPFQRPGLMVPA